MMRKRDWSTVTRRALDAQEVTDRLSELTNWKLDRNGGGLAIEKIYSFANYYETISFVNAVAFVANAQDHHPELSVHYDRCIVRFNTHDVQGVSETDLECAMKLDVLLV